MMNLSDQLGYRHLAPGAIRRLVQRIFFIKPLTRFVAAVAHRIDLVWLRISGGRTTATAVFLGLRVLWLTTTGAKSGQARTVPLVGFPHGNGLALLGTHFGTEHTPGWVFNLLANPNASVRWRDTDVAVIARRLTESEAAPAWETAASLYPGYRYYREWASHRKIEVFLLETA